jgi:hypothetical protein
MAVIDEYYSSRLDVGPPAAVAYMAGFMGERERMNRAIIDDMLKAADPAALAEAEKNARDALNDLLKLKQQAQVAGGKANVDVIKALLQYKGTERGAIARERSAVTAARGMVARSFLNAESRKQEAIVAGRDAAAEGRNIATAAASQAYATEQAQVNGYETALRSASAATKVGTGNLVGFAGKAASLKLAEDALAAAQRAGHTAAAEYIKRTYFSGKEPSQYYQESDFRPKTEQEILQEVAQIPSGGVGGLSNIAKVVEGELGMDTGELGRLVYGVKVGGKTLEERYGTPTPDDLDSVASAALAAASPAADSGDLDQAIKDVNQRIKDLQEQRGRRPSLQEIAASRYPNYLYTNPFQVRSAQFDRFQRDVERLSPRGQERYLEAMADAPPVLPSVFARRKLERTEPAEIPTEGFRFREEGVDTSAPGEMVVSKVADLLEKTKNVYSQPMALGDRGDTVEFVMRDGKPAVKITENTKDKKVTFAPVGSDTYKALAAKATEEAPKLSGLQAYLDSLPDSVSERELAPVFAAASKGGYGAAAEEARRLKETGGDVGLYEVYARELQDIAGDPDAVKRNDRLEALRGKVPSKERASWGPALQRVIDASSIDTATEGARDLSGALRDAFPEGLAAEIQGEEPTRFETRAAQEEEKKRQGRGPVPAATTEELPTVESVIGLPPSKLASKKEREDYEKKRAGLDTLRKNNKQAYLDLVREERATRGAKAPSATSPGAERTTEMRRPGSATSAPGEGGALSILPRTPGEVAADTEYKAKYYKAGVEQALNEQPDLSFTMLGAVPIPTVPVTGKSADQVMREGRDAFIQSEREYFASGKKPALVPLSEDRSAAVKQSEKDMAAYKAKQQPGRSGPLPSPRVVAPVTQADLTAADALVESMPVSTPTKASPAKPAKPTGTGTFGADREKKTPPPPAKKSKQKQAEEDADAL